VTIPDPTAGTTGSLALAASTAAGPDFAAYRVGHHPDMVTFCPDGHTLLIANEGQPNPAYTVDPPGSVTVVRLPASDRSIREATVTDLDFDAWNDRRFHTSLHRSATRSTLAQDLEPEFVAVAPDGRRAWVTLQENNAVATIDLQSLIPLDIHELGFKNHALPGQGLDASDKDGATNIRNWPVSGLYQPDGIAAWSTADGTFLITANEGDTREYAGYDETARAADLRLDDRAMRRARSLQTEEGIGRLLVTKAGGDSDGDGQYEKLISFGGRSVSIWTADLRQIWDSGDELEHITATLHPEYFNSDNDEQRSFDSRSDQRGPEPEGVAIGMLHGRHYAFIGLERIGGVMVYEVTDPWNEISRSVSVYAVLTRSPTP